MALSKKVLPRKKGFDKRQRFNHDKINVLPRDKGLARKYKFFA
jgi:hypothetical protein